ncbi:MAG TPA: DMT family transporter [Candidatus Dormibacteraeota bacterium]|nr:DMT family transporter [Candidatus Dormibacteraeota bacterium]
MSEARHPLLPYAALAGLALIWGASFLFIKVAVQDMSPTVLLLLRSASGALVLALVVRAMGRPLLGEGWRRRLGSFAIMALTNAVVPWILIAWGEERISSGLASILNSTTTLWTAVLIYWAIPTERPSMVNYVGVVVGFAGVVILVLPDISSHGVSGNFFGAMAVVLAALSYAVNAIYQRRKMRKVSVFEVSLGQLMATVLFAIPLAAPSLPHVHIALSSMAAVLALGAGGTGVAYLLYFYVINTLGAVRAAGVTLLVPVTAVFWGVVLLHETLSLPVLAGMVVILVGIVLTNLRRSVRSAPVAERESAVA